VGSSGGGEMFGGGVGDKFPWSEGISLASLAIVHIVARCFVAPFCYKCTRAVQ